MPSFRRWFVALALLVGLPAALHAQPGPSSGPWGSVVFSGGSFDTDGEGSPENVIVGCPGATYRQTDGAAGNVFWGKDGGTGCDATGWVIIGAGGSGSSHTTLSHTDATGDAVVRGAVIVGLSGPIWGRKTPTLAGQVLRFDGTDTDWSTNGSALTFNASNATSGTLAAARLPQFTGGDVTSASAGVALLTLEDDAVVTAKLADGAVTFVKMALNGCTAGQVGKVNAGETGWECGDMTGGGGGAPTDISFITRVNESGISNEFALEDLDPGLLLTDGDGNPSAYAGDACDPGDFVTDIAADGTVTCDTPATGSGHTIADEGTPLTARSTLNFTGAGVNCSDDEANDETDCTISGGGSGTAWRMFFPAMANMPPSSNAATFDVVNSTPVLEFDTTTQETAIFLGVLPANYGGGGIRVCTHWAAASATSGTIGWDASFERIGDGSQNISADGFASANTITATTVPGTAGLVDITCVTATDGANIDNLAAGELFRLRIRRDVSNDDASGDAWLLAIDLKEP